MHNKWMRLVIALGAGALYPLGFAPFSWWPISIFSITILFTLWLQSQAVQTSRYTSEHITSLSRSKYRDAILIGLAFGLGSYVVGTSWVYVSMVNFGGMAPLMAVIAVILFALILTSFYMILGFVYTFLAPLFTPQARLITLLPSLWVGFEYLRGTILTGFPWLQLGYSATNTWMGSWASLSGVLAVSWLLAFFAALIAQIIQLKSSRAFVQVGLIIIALTALSWGLQQIKWSKPSGDLFRTTLIQQNILLSQKWQPDQRQAILQSYLKASQAVTNSQLIVWPEGALPLNFEQLNLNYLAQLKQLNTPLIFGVGSSEQHQGGSNYYNTMVALQNDSIQMYRKFHLVPFGEYFPLKSILGWLFETLKIPMSNYASGTKAQPNLKINGITLLPTICYEDAFPQDWRHKVSQAQIILNISEDAWFGDSFAPHQRLQMAQMRAIEFARPVIRISNSGLSTVIDANGKYQDISAQFAPQVFTAEVTPMQGDTPYTRYGLWPLGLFLLLNIMLATLIRLRKT